MNKRQKRDAAESDGVSRRRFLSSSLLVGSTALAASSMLARGASAGAAAQHVAWLSEVQQPPEGAAELPRQRITTAAGEPIESLEAWQTERERLSKWWLEYLGPLPGERREVPRLELLEQDQVEGVIRQRVRYEIEPGLITQAYVLKPVDANRQQHPGVAVFHSTVQHSILQPAGVQGKPEKAFGLKLAQRGCVTICPRNYLWPENTRIAAEEEAETFLERHRGSKGMAKMLYDALVAVDILAGLPEVDTRRLGAVGHSLGAKEVLYLAAFDPRIKATVSSEGGIGTTFSNWDAPWYLGSQIREAARQHEHHELLALTAPRAFLLIGGDSADGRRSWPYVEAALQIYRLYDSVPRVGLFNHQQGHAVPPAAEQRIYEWFDAYL